MVEDGGSPRLSDTTVVEVEVTRNLNKPRFNTATYTTRVTETLPLGASIKTVTANDADKRVRQHAGRLLRKNLIFGKASLDTGSIDYLLTLLYSSRRRQF